MMQAETETIDGHPVVPAPVSPTDSSAWYAPTVVAQYSVTGRTVVTIERSDTQLRYVVREPALTARGHSTVDQFLEALSVEYRTLAPTRDCVSDRLHTELSATYRSVIPHSYDKPGRPSIRRRVRYYLHSRSRCLDALTPIALDDRVSAVGISDGELWVSTPEGDQIFTTVSLDSVPDRAVDGLRYERLRRHTVSFLEFEIPVVIGQLPEPASDGFRRIYRPCEPPLLPGDSDLLSRAGDRLWERASTHACFEHGGADRSVTGTPPDHSTIESTIRRLAGTVIEELDGTNDRNYLRSAWKRLTSLGWGTQADSSASEDRSRRRGLLYYLLRDTLGFERLTVPICDGWLEDIEVNRVDDRVKVIASDGGYRLPTPIRFDTEHELENLVVQLAGQDGVELTASNPSAKVNLTPPGDTTETIRCALALGVISEDGPHISIRKQRPEPLGPIDLIKNGSVPVSLVALLWLVFELHGVVLFCGPTGVGKTTLMNAHLPFIPRCDRPISIDEGSREVRLPHETGVSLRTRTHADPHKEVSMAELMTEANYLNPDVEIIAEINTPESFATFGESIATGHGIIGTTHAQTVERLANRFVEQGLGIHLLAAVDLLVFPRFVGGERFVGTVCTPFQSLTNDDETTITRNGTTIGYETLIERSPNGEFAISSDSSPFNRLFEPLGARTNTAVETIEASYHDRRRRVTRLLAKGSTGVASIGRHATTGLGGLCDPE
ncbi:type II/IV secretion system ATPase subunit [Halocatena halophila]|uniref:type II/IV secretion system ATPase subunit n=1 Tax=Halocatena halophila TaxID=2814576 RepID=UPI002ED3C7AB